MPHHPISQCKKLLGKKMKENKLTKKLLIMGKTHPEIFSANIDDEGRNLYLYFAKNEQWSVVKTLIQSGLAGKDALLKQDRNKQNLLHYNILSPGCDIEFMQLLCDLAPDLINQQDNHGNPPLFLALENALDAVVRVLVKTQKVDLKIKNKSGQTVYNLAGCQQTILHTILRKDFQNRMEDSSELCGNYEQKLAEKFPLIYEIHTPKSEKSNQAKRLSRINPFASFSSSTQSINSDFITPPSSNRSHSSSKSFSLRDIKTTMAGSEASLDEEKNLTTHNPDFETLTDEFIKLLLSEHLDDKTVNKPRIKKKERKERKKNKHRTRHHATKSRKHHRAPASQKDSAKAKKSQVLKLLNQHDKALILGSHPLDCQIAGLQNEQPTLEIFTDITENITRIPPAKIPLAYYTLWQSLYLNRQSINWHDERNMEILASFYDQNLRTSIPEDFAKKVNKKLITLVNSFNDIAAVETIPPISRPRPVVFASLVDQAMKKCPDKRREDVNLIAEELTKMTSHFYRHVSITEFYQSNYHPAQRKTRAPNIVQFTDYINHLVNFLAHKIVSAPPVSFVDTIKLMLEITKRLWQPPTDQYLDFQSITILAAALSQVDVSRLINSNREAFTVDELKLIAELEDFCVVKGIEIQKTAIATHENILPPLNQILSMLTAIIDNNKKGPEKCGLLGERFKKILAIQERLERDYQASKNNLLAPSFLFLTDLPDFMSRYAPISDEDIHLLSRYLQPLPRDIVDLDSFHSGCKHALGYVHDNFVKQNRIPFIKFNKHIHPPQHAPEVIVQWFRHHFMLACDIYQHELKSNKKNDIKDLAPCNEIKNGIKKKYSELLPLLEGVLLNLQTISLTIPNMTINKDDISEQMMPLKKQIICFSDETRHSKQTLTKKASAKTIGLFRSISQEVEKLDRIHSLGSERSSGESGIVKEHH